MAPDEWMAALGYDIWNRHARAHVEALQWALAQDLPSVGVHVVIEWGTWGRSIAPVWTGGAARRDCVRNREPGVRTVALCTTPTGQGQRTLTTGDFHPGAQQRRQAGRPRATASVSSTRFQPGGTWGWAWTTPSAPPPSRSSSITTTPRARALTPCGAAPQRGLVWYAVGCGPTHTWRCRVPGRCGWQKTISQVGQASPRDHQSGSMTTSWPTGSDGGWTRPAPGRNQPVGRPSITKPSGRYETVAVGADFLAGQEP